MTEAKELIRVEDSSPEPLEPSPADKRAMAGLVMSWVAVALGGVAWLLALVFLAAFRRNFDVGLWLVGGAVLAGLVGGVLSWIARRRVRDASPLHASLDFVSTFAWHVCWTALVATLLCIAQLYFAWQAAREEVPL